MAGDCLVGFDCANCQKPEPVLMGVVQQFSSCSGCGFKRYCSRDCQKDHWKEHKKKCSTIKVEYGGIVSKKKQNIACHLLSRILHDVEDPRFFKKWHTIAKDFMKRGQGIKGVIWLRFESIEEAETALLSGIHPGVGKTLKWFRMRDPDALLTEMPEQSKCVSQYDPQNQFVFSVEIRDRGNTTKIIGRDTTRQLNTNNPFDPFFSDTRVLLPVRHVIGDAEDVEARKKLVKYIKDCIRALGLPKTPIKVRQRLSAYVKDNEAYYSHVEHNDTVFIFCCNLSIERSTIQDLISNYKRAVLLM
jgi:hypothetical protein